MGWVGEGQKRRACAHLLEKEKSSLVVSGLPHLQQRLPRLFGSDVAAAVALHWLDLEINDEALLNDGVLEHLLECA